MELMNLFNFLTEINTTEELCNELEPVLRIVGIVLLGIRIVVPILLIVMGMLDFAKAVTEKDEKNMKEAQSKLVKRAVAAVAVFLITSIVPPIITLLTGDSDYKGCMNCIEKPFTCKAPGTEPNDN